MCHQSPGKFQRLLTRDRGKTWQLLPDMPQGAGNRAVNMIFDSHNPGRIIMAMAKGVYRSNDDGQTWIACNNNLHRMSDREHLYDLAGGSDGKQLVLYLTMPSRHHGDDLHTGIYRSVNAGDSWERVQGKGLYQTYNAKDKRQPQYQRLAVSAQKPQVVYVTFSGIRKDDVDELGNSNIFRSEDGGKTFKPIFWQHPQSKHYTQKFSTWVTGKWGWLNGPFSLSVCESQPDSIAVTTITGIYTSHDAGKSWLPGHATAMNNQTQSAGGMAMLTTWDYVVDPKKSNRHHIASSDFASWTSTDSGKNWHYRPDGNPWHHNVYAYALDSGNSNRIWAASSKLHDIPTWRYLSKMQAASGGIVISEDAGMTWRPVGQQQGLPNKAMTDIIAIAQPNNNMPRLFCAALGAGVFTSTNGGESWQDTTANIDKWNRNLLRIRHNADGKLYALSTIRITGKNKFSPGSLYVSNDMGSRWTKIFQRNDSPYPADITFDPSDPNTLYVSCMERQIHGGQAGLFRSSDAGKTWRKLYGKPCFSVTVSPENNKHLYLASWEMIGGGLQYSIDHGKTWKVDQTFPFWRPLRIINDRQDKTKLYVTTFGNGVWHGPAPK